LRGSGDYWTPSPSRINAVAEKMGTGARGGRSPEADMALWAELHTPVLFNALYASVVP